ncbi:MAG TPA: ribbon-helix-helix protein, CopG family [Thermoanaerobaculia bacterium]|nr:ribbon-helix-helix protein, CopG family [Thermoanaerobaculia bacterium]
MRTTMTLDDDLAKQLREEARRTGRSFKDVVNDALRRGLAAGAAPAPRPSRFRVRPKACGFQPGIDLRKLNQLVDEMEIDHVIRDR